MFGRSRKQPTPVPDVPAVPVASARFSPKSPSDTLKPSAPPPPPPRIRKPRGGLLSMLSGVLTFGVVAGGAAMFGLLVLEREVGAPGPLADDKVVMIPKGASTPEVTELLTREGVIESPQLFEAYALLNRRRGQLKAGEFLFRAHVDVEDAIDTLIQGKAILHSITAPEGLTSEQIVQRLRDSDVLVGDVNEVPREGTLLPDTYKVERGTARQQIISLMQAAQRQALAQAWNKRAPDLGIKTPQELVILASIVEKETGLGIERPRVASVFVNRLSRRMKLQSDPTIVYGIVGGKGTLGRGITRAEIERATPYNTYVIEGLPPGPIANPGRAALEAAASPVKTKDLYFVADGTGGHTFAETYDQHLRNVARWRAVERARDITTPGAPSVDRADPPPVPDTRTEVSSDPALPRSASAYAPDDGLAPSPGRGGPRAFDASEGTPKDPLQNQAWDLNSPKNVPSFGMPATTVSASKREAAQKREVQKPEAQKRRARARTDTSAQGPAPDAPAP